ncbi:hypothetical protein LZ32DRAFT_76985 [Colletotrichum eremochloae]|nr:hypothetical protein LZ32DRAFT_76985 [Colletotrichum eremochloae]
MCVCMVSEEPPILVLEVPPCRSRCARGRTQAVVVFPFRDVLNSFYFLSARGVCRRPVARCILALPVVRNKSPGRDWEKEKEKALARDRNLNRGRDLTMRVGITNSMGRGSCFSPEVQKEKGKVPFRGYSLPFLPIYCKPEEALGFFFHDGLTSFPDFLITVKPRLIYQRTPSPPYPTP